MIITSCILLVFVLYFVLNSFLLPKYYLYQMKNHVHDISDELNEMSLKDLHQSVTEYEKKYNVTIAIQPITSNNDEFNGALRDSLNQKKVTLNKFWVTEDTIQQVKEGKKVSKIYDQGKLKSSFLVDFIQKDQQFILIGVSIVYLSEAVQIVNQFTISIMILLILILISLVWIWSKKITDPLKELKDISKEIAKLDFRKVDINTNDEIEELAESINEMSEKLRIAHEDLNERNANLKRFISDITHELKTPLALIKAYSVGIQDGIDDGSYVETILKQTDHINHLIDELLLLSRIERETLQIQKVDFIHLVNQCIQNYEIELNRSSITLHVDQSELQHVFVEADLGQMERVIDNLLSNAVKYTENKEIFISFKENEEEYLFYIENNTKFNNPEQLQNVWEPFYVMEASRNKNMSGTGLGLAIVKSILNRHQFKHDVTLTDGKIRFTIHYRKKKKEKPHL
ncbi:HAMP domain-containing sensor histidine kinase [Bacillus sp. JJ664]